MNRNRKNAGSSLENFAANGIKPVDKYARKTSGSGNHNEISDIYSELFFVEAKQQLTHENLIVNRKVWQKLIDNMPLGSLKIPFMILENKLREKFVVIDAKDFFRIVEKAYKEKE